MDIVFGIVNHSSVTDLLTGKIHRHKRTESTNDKKEIVINSLANVNDPFVQEGVMNVNVYCPNLSNNTPDEDSLKEITETITARIEAYLATDHYYVFEIESQNLITDERDESYMNIRVNFYIENS